MKMQPESKTIVTREATIPTLGTNISLVLMLRSDGVRSLSVTVDAVTSAIVLWDGTSVNWTIFEGDTVHSVAGAPTTSELRARIATGEGM